jgi:IstB-like ATP binding protein
MERTQLFELMSELRLYGMKAAYDEILATGIKRQHEPPRIISDLLQAEVSEKQARSIKYQIRIAKLPLAKDLGDSKARPSTNASCAISRKATFLLTSATASSSVGPVPARPISL